MRTPTSLTCKKSVDINDCLPGNHGDTTNEMQTARQVATSYQLAGQTEVNPDRGKHKLVKSQINFNQGSKGTQTGQKLMLPLSKHTHTPANKLKVTEESSGDFCGIW